MNNLSEKEFQTFFKWLPARVQMLVKSGLVSTEKVLAEWYALYLNPKPLEPISPDDIPF